VNTFSKMAKGYFDDGRGGTLPSEPPNRPPPSRPARRIDSVRGRGDDGASSYRGGHYAESPVISTLPTSTSHDPRASDRQSLQVSTLPRSTGQPVYLPSGGTTTVAKVMNEFYR